MKLRPGDVWRGYIPYIDGPFKAGESNHETGKERPVVILGYSPLGASESDDVILVVPITSFGRTGHPVDGDVSVDDWEGCGLSRKSWIRARRLYAMAPRSLDGQRGRLGSVSSRTLDAVYEEIAKLIDPTR